MSARPVAESVDALVAGASSRTPMAFDDSKSGARFERVVLDGDDFLLKHVDPHDDWIMRQTGDIGCIPIRVWESGVFDLVPDVIDHATVGAARSSQSDRTVANPLPRRHCARRTVMAPDRAVNRCSGDMRTPAVARSVAGNSVPAG